MSKFLELMRPLVLSRVEKMQCIDNITPDVPDFCQIFASKKLTIIAEIKYRSPTGLIYNGTLSSIEIAKDYYTAGAKAISVLTEPHYFDGDASRITEIHQTIPELPILMKDFILSIKQIQQARSLGASAVLLIVRFLSRGELHELYHCGLELGLTPLLEVHDRYDLERALEINPNVIGINNRNLETLNIDDTTTEKLLPDIPSHIHVVSESGLHSKAQLEHFQQFGCNGFLIGSHLMINRHPGSALQQLLQGDGDAC